MYALRDISHYFLHGFSTVLMLLLLLLLLLDYCCSLFVSQDDITI
jgi:hypothetical protein